MQKYLIKLTTYPISQHPNRYLEVVSENLLWVMDQYQRNRHAFKWEIVSSEIVSDEMKEMCREIKYKYDDKV